MGVPRYNEDVQVLEQDYCEKLMKKQLKAKRIKHFKVKPKVLCVGKNKTTHVRTYIKHSNRKYHLLKQSKFSGHPKVEKILKQKKWYIIGKALCFYTIAL